ncbi:MAG: NUDIX domain-containing protein [Alphaproteobacteria bacterium]
MNRADVDIIEKTEVYRGRFQVFRYRLRHRLHAGGWSGIVTREVFERGHAAAVLPYDPLRDEVVLIEQFRPGAYAAGGDPWLLEIVAGIIDADESAEDVAHREAKEEANLILEDLLPVAHCFMTPGACSESLQIFCGRTDSTGAGGVFGLPTEHEDIRVLAVPFAEARRMLDTLELRNAITVISMQWLALHRDRLRREWRMPS